MLKKAAILILIFLVSLEGGVVPTAFSSQAPNVLTFESFWQKVLLHYPLLKKQNARVEEAIAVKHQAVTGFLPRFRGVTSWTVGDDPVYVFSSLLKQGAFTESNFAIPTLNDPRHRSNTAFAIEGEWTIFDAFRTVSNVRASGHYADSEKLQEKFIRMEASLVALEAFSRALLEEKAFQITSEVLKKTDEDIREAESLKDKGLVLGADFYAAKVMAGGIGQMKNGLDKKRASTRVLLNILMGEDPLAEMAMPQQLLAQTPKTKALKEWLQTAYQERADLASLESVVLAKKAELFREKSGILPSFSAFGRIEENTHDWDSGKGNYLIGIKGDIDIFDFAHPAKVAQKEEQLKQAKAVSQALKDGIASSLAEENARYETLLENTPLVTQTSQDAKMAVELTEKLYREGRKSIADLMEMRRIYIEAAIRDSELNFYTETQYSRLLFLAGALNDETLKEISSRFQ